jgi:hypothetical protein
MADFRGVSKEAVIDSFVRAGQFLKQLDLGVHTAEVLDGWDKNGAATKLGAARDDKKLAEAVKQTGALSNLSYYQDLFMYHAAVERADGSETQMQNLYRDLMAWSAFFDGTASPNSDIGREVRAHIVVNLLDRMNAAGIDADACHEKLAQTVGELKKKDGKLADWLDSAVPVAQLLHSSVEPTEFRQWLAGPSSNQTGCLQRALYGISNLPPEETVNAVPKAIDIYRVTMNNQPDSPNVMPDRQWAGYVETVQRKFRLAMIPFAETAQTSKIEVKPLSGTGDKWGISFYGTLGAAQGAATTLRQYNLSVVDSQGRTIEPPPLLRLTGPSNPSPQG